MTVQALLHMRKISIALLMLALTACSNPLAPRANYQGVWNGTYTVESCSATGSAAGPNGACQFVWPMGSTLPIRLDLTQDDEIVGGRVIFGQIISDAFSTAIASDDSLRITVPASLDQTTFSISIRINEAGSGTIEMALATTLPGTQLFGTARMTGRMTATR